MRLAVFVAANVAVMLVVSVGISVFATSYPDRYRLVRQDMRSVLGLRSGAGTASESPMEQKPAPSAQADRLPIPNVDGMVMLIRRYLNALNHANKTNNYSVLRELSGSDLQKANSGARMSDAFAQLRNRNVDLLAVNVINPRLAREPSIDGDGRLRLTGYFPSRPEQIKFDLMFQAEKGTWRLFGIAVDAVPVDAATPKDPVPGPVVEPRDPPGNTPRINRRPQLPDAETIAALARDSVLALNQANATGNYAILRDLGAPGFQQFNTHARLAEAFAGLRARHLDLGPTTVISPRFFRPPSIDTNGMLRLTGYFPSRPEQVNFDLAYQMVDGGWKIFGIGVNTSRLVPAGAGTGSPGQGTPGAELKGPAPDAAPSEARAPNSTVSVATPAATPTPKPRPDR